MPAETPDRSRLRASDNDRRVVTDLLDAAYADGRLTIDEHSDRCDRALTAVTFADLTDLTSDLVPLDRPIQDVVAPPRTGGPLVEPGHKSSGPLVAIFGGANRIGRFHVGSSMSVTTAFGGVELDLTEATFESSTTVLTVNAWFGGADIYVPAGMRVRNDVISLFGGIELKGTDVDTREDSPLIILKGTCLFGGVDVYGPDTKQARKWRRRHGRTHDE